MQVIQRNERRRRRPRVPGMNELVPGGSACADGTRPDAAGRQLRLTVLRQTTTQQPLNETRVFRSENAVLEAPSRIQRAIEAAMFLVLRELRGSPPGYVAIPRAFSIRALHPWRSHLLVDPSPMPMM